MDKFMDTGVGGEINLEEVEEAPIPAEKVDVAKPKMGRPKKEEPLESKIDIKIKELKKLSRKVDLLKDVIQYSKKLKRDSDFPLINSEVGDIVEVLINKIIDKLENSIN